MACKLGAPWTHLEFGPGVIKCRADRSLEAFSGLQTRRGEPNSRAFVLLQHLPFNDFYGSGEATKRWKPSM